MNALISILVFCLGTDTDARVEYSTHTVIQLSVVSTYNMYMKGVLIWCFYCNETMKLEKHEEYIFFLNKTTEKIWKKKLKIKICSVKATLYQCRWVLKCIWNYTHFVKVHARGASLRSYVTFTSSHNFERFCILGKWSVETQQRLRALYFSEAFVFMYISWCQWMLWKFQGISLYREEEREVTRWAGALTFRLTHPASGETRGPHLKRRSISNKASNPNPMV